MKTLFDKIWDAHVVTEVKNGPTQLYIDRHFCHEVTSPQAFEGLRARGLKVFRPEQTILTADHNIPTMDQDKPIPNASRFFIILAFPEVLPSAYSRERPNRSGRRSLK
jgi:3-isopropylmalate/(R)-2-methylmalate dehydratase large subunit